MAKLCIEIGDDLITLARSGGGYSTATYRDKPFRGKTVSYFIGCTLLVSADELKYLVD